MSQLNRYLDRLTQLAKELQQRQLRTLLLEVPKVIREPFPCIGSHFESFSRLYYHIIGYLECCADHTLIVNEIYEEVKRTLSAIDKYFLASQSVFSNFDDNYESDYFEIKNLDRLH